MDTFCIDYDNLKEGKHFLPVSLNKSPKYSIIKKY